MSNVAGTLLIACCRQALCPAWSDCRGILLRAGKITPWTRLDVSRFYAASFKAIQWHSSTPFYRISMEFANDRFIGQLRQELRVKRKTIVLVIPGHWQRMLFSKFSSVCFTIYDCSFHVANMDRFVVSFFKRRRIDLFCCSLLFLILYCAKCILCLENYESTFDFSGTEWKINRIFHSPLQLNIFYVFLLTKDVSVV